MENSLTDLFTRHIEKYGMAKETFFTKEDDEYIPFSNKELIRQIYNVMKFFRDHDLKESDKVAIISENCTEWVVVDFACMFMKLISIPIYTSQSLLQIEYILDNSDSAICFVSNTNLLGKVMQIKSNLPKLKDVVAFKNTDTSKFNNDHVTLFSEIISRHDSVSDTIIMDHLKELSAKVSGSDIVTMIYTSGTTGIPKGVMLTHNNIYSNITSCQKVLVIDDKDTFLSYLPYSHSYERTTGYYLPLFCGAKIYYAQNIDTIAGQLTETNPTIVITVPRLLDKIYNKLINSSEDMKDGFKKKIFKWAIDIARNNSRETKNSLSWKVADMLVYKKIREKTGGKIRFFVSGGGALNKSIGDFFEMTGIEILEGYGMTETSPVISVNPPHKNKYGTVGLPLSGVEVRLSEENEILVKGDLVMKGYYKDELATGEVIKDGWLCTGDIGMFDEDGYLKITDRKKSLMKTSGGKYVSPTQIEDLILSLHYVENAMVIGNERMYITAIITADKNEMIKFASKNNISFSSFSELLNNRALQKLIQKDIDNLQKDLANYERIRKFSLLEDHFSIEGGELTPTLKVKRKFVEEKYKEEIDNMYLKI